MKASPLPAFLRRLRPRQFVNRALVAFLAAVAVTGCTSLTEPASASFASVVIEGRSVEEIAAATGKVFAEDGFQGPGGAGANLVFEKEGSRARSWSRAGLVGTQSGERTIIRVKAEIVSLPDGAHRLQCQAYDVTGSGDAFFDDEVALRPARSGHYRALLRQVEQALK